jgi:flagellar protein FlgJ
MITREQFVKQYFPIAAAVATGSGIFPEVVISAAILESSGKINGVYYPGQSLLAQRANNFFGIKNSAAWKGPTITLNTGEVYNGIRVTVPGTFRKYTTARDSFADYIKFLQDNPRYKNAGVFAAKTPQEQTAALQRAGYATDPNYSSLLNSIMKGIQKFIPTGAAGGALGLLLILGLILYATR